MYTFFAYFFASALNGFASFTIAFRIPSTQPEWNSILKYSPSALSLVNVVAFLGFKIKFYVFMIIYFWGQNDGLVGNAAKHLIRK